VSLREQLEGEDVPYEGAPPSVRRGGLRFAHQTYPLVALTLDFAALPRAQWDDLLGNVRALGFRMVDVIVTWERHATREGRFDFGERAAELDLGEFLRLVSANGLLACLRPGPRQFGREGVLHGGVPANVATDPQCLRPGTRTPALSGGLLEAPEPSLASARYLEYAQSWLEAVGSATRALRYPRGPVVAVHLEWARTLLPYESGLGDKHFDALRQGSNQRVDLDWVSSQERLAVDALQMLAMAFGRGCPGLPVTFPEFAVHSRLKLRFLDVAMRYPPDARRWATARQSAVADPLGGLVPLVDVDLERETHGLPLHQVLVSLAAGARGFSVTPGVRPTGSITCLLTEGGEPTRWMTELAPLLAALERTQFHTLELEPCVHIVLCDRLLHLERVEQARARSEGWLAREPSLARDSRPPLSGELGELAEVRRALGWLEQSLTRNGVPFRHCSEWELDAVVGAAPWVVVPTPTWIAEELRETLQYALRRGSPCSVGPYLPEGLSDDRSGWPFLLGTTLQAVESQVQELLAQGQLPRRDVSPSVARVLFHTRPEPKGAVPAVAFVFNTSGSPIEVSLACPGWTARDALSQGPIASFAERLLVTVPGESLRMLELSATDAPG
jgi:hypothetical protein